MGFWQGLNKVTFGEGIPSNKGEGVLDQLNNIKIMVYLRSWYIFKALLRNPTQGANRAWNRSEKLALGFTSHHKESDLL